MTEGSNFPTIGGNQTPESIATKRYMNIKIQANRIFEEADRSKCRYVVMKGSAGSGKSVDTAQHYILRLMTDRGRNLLALRKSEVTNRDSTFAELQSAIGRMGVEAYWQVRKSPLELECVNGNKIVFRGMNDQKQREKIKSITFASGKLTDIWLEEATEFTQEDLEILDDRLRGELPEGLFYQIRLTFNPVSASHWIKRVFFDREDEDVFTHHSTYLDNRFHDTAYHQRMLRRRETDPEGYRIYGLGQWGELGGLILTNWKAEEISRRQEDYDAVYLGQDFGFNHANAILTLGFRDGDLYILDEIYVHGKDTGEIIALARQQGLSDRATMFCDSAEPDRIKMWRTAGFRARPVRKEPGCIGAQIDFLKQRNIHVHPACVNTIRELGQWRWKYDDGAGAYLDEPLEVMDDAMAALRYGIEGMRKVRRIGGLEGLQL